MWAAASSTGRELSPRGLQLTVLRPCGAGTDPGGVGRVAREGERPNWAASSTGARVLCQGAARGVWVPCGDWQWWMPTAGAAEPAPSFQWDASMVQAGHGAPCASRHEACTGVVAPATTPSASAELVTSTQLHQHSHCCPGTATVTPGTATAAPPTRSPQRKPSCRCAPRPSRRRKAAAPAARQCRPHTAAPGPSPLHPAGSTDRVSQSSCPAVP